MKRAFALSAAGLAILLAAPTLAATPKEPLPGPLTGKVVAVADEDTMSVTWSLICASEPITGA